MGFFSSDKPENLAKLLQKAVVENEVNTAVTLVERGADIEGTPGFCPLEYAIKKDQTRMVEALLKAGANPNRHVGVDSTLLMKALESWRFEIALNLLQYGADPNFHALNGAMPLAFGIEKYRTSAVAKMVEKSAEVNLPDANGNYPLHAVMQYGGANMARLLLDHGAAIDAVDKNGATALHLAARAGYAETVILLLERGADATIADKEMKTPAVYAQQKEYHGLAAILRGETPAPLAKQASAGGWKLVADDEVARVTLKNAVGYRVMEIFNFTARTYTQVLRNLDSGAESQAVKSFSAVSEGGLVGAARDALVRLGGHAADRGFEKKKLPGPGLAAGGGA